ncbi:MAG TPA: ABC transporter ATP-binding protein [Firmicutes bacterium]|nr:ABC transporter ATP-binding protein [Candidatus Fermentithermobacillaceae bacterium]
MSGGRVTVQDLVFRRGGREVLKGISFEVEPGRVAAVVGPNGAGKSTLLKVISGYLKPASGSVTVCGVDPASLHPSERSRLVTYSGDEPDPAFAFTVQETVEMGRVAAEAPVSRADLAGALEEALEALQLAGLRDRPITSLSSGERQRVYLARALYQDPLVILLDEPTTHLDMAYEVHVAGMIRDLARRGKTVLTVVHDLNLALRCADRLVFLRDGRLLYNVAPGDVTSEIVGDIYGVEVRVASHPVLGTPFVTPPSSRKA